MQFPRTEQERLAVAKDFGDLWNFPNCGRSIDGKNVRIVAPHDSGLLFYNYKGFHSVVLLGLVNAKYEFLVVDAGTNGRISDRGVMENTTFGRKLREEELNLPSNEDTTYNLNFVFTGDNAFTLHKNFLTPFTKNNLTTKRRKIYNNCVSRARRVVENAFGISANRFRVFHTAINLPLQIDKVVLACCMLHNLLCVRGRISYVPPSYIYQEDTETGIIKPGECRGEVEAFSGLNKMVSSKKGIPLTGKVNQAKNVSYFSGPCTVSWQDYMI